MANSKKQEVKKRDNIKKASDSSIEMAQDLPVFIPATDIYENSDSILVYSDMPGVDEKNVDITLEDDVLVLTGHQCLCEPKELELIYRGYNPGIYRRSFTLMAPIDRDKISAKINNGVLTIVLPKAEQAKPKKITVQAG